jgi:hypothetical protein
MHTPSTIIASGITRSLETNSSIITSKTIEATAMSSAVSGSVVYIAMIEGRRRRRSRFGTLRGPHCR